MAEAQGASIAVKLSVIAASIPHPTLDKAIADTEMENLWDIFAPRYAEKPGGAGPPVERIDKSPDLQPLPP